MLKYGLLGLLSYNKLSGYDLTKAFKESIGFFWTANMSQVYRELNTMLKDNWLESEIQLQDGKPNKKIYSITALGKQELFEWLTTYNGKSYFTVRNSFLVNIFLSGHKDIDDNISMLINFRNDCLEYAQYLQNTGDSIEHYSTTIENESDAVYWDIVADLGKSQLSTTLDWVNRSIDKLEKINESTSN